MPDVAAADTLRGSGEQRGAYNVLRQENARPYGALPYWVIIVANAREEMLLPRICMKLEPGSRSVRLRC
jgi:hypothetical protein